MRKHKVREYQRRVEIGLCVLCGSKPLATKRLCSRCRAYAREAGRARRELIRNQGYTARGLRPVSPNKSKRLY